MRRARNRQRKIVANDELVALFRAALPAQQALWLDAVSSRRRMTVEQHAAAVAAVHALHNAAGVKPWEHGPLSPHATNAALQAALVAKLDGDDLKAWRRYSRHWQKQRDADMAEYEITPARRKRKADDVPRPSLRWSKSSGGW